MGNSPTQYKKSSKTKSNLSLSLVSFQGKVAWTYIYTLYYQLPFVQYQSHCQKKEHYAKVFEKYDIIDYKIGLENVSLVMNYKT